MHQRLAQYRHAVDRYRHALRLAHETGTRYAELVALVGLADVQLQLARHDEADAYARKALTLASQGGFRVVERPERRC